MIYTHLDMYRCVWTQLLQVSALIIHRHFTYVLTVLVD